MLNKTQFSTKIQIENSENIKCTRSRYPKRSATERLHRSSRKETPL